MTTLEAPPTIIPLAVTIPEGTEACDVELAEHHESIDVGPFAGAYLRLCAPDLVVAVDQARRLLDLIEEAVLDARQEQIEVERQRCYCGAPLAGEITCGDIVCDRRYAEDLGRF